MSLILTPPAEGRILLHACCAPCSGAILECMIQNGLRPTVFFSNSNIAPFEEYELRKAELMRYCEAIGIEAVDDDYNHEAWLEHIKGFENEPERGRRCAKCFGFRLLRAASYAAEHDFGVFTTTLAGSRWKILSQVHAAGIWACEQVSKERSLEKAPVVYWEMNWRKGGLQPRRGEIVCEQNFYNQSFCGCEFSHPKQ